MKSATLIDGKAKAAELEETVTAAAAALLRDSRMKPGLAVILVGEDPASRVYVRNKTRMAESCGFHSIQHTLAAETPQREVLALLEDLNNDPSIHGILVQLPLPDQLDAETITQSVAPEKDVDGFHFVNIGKLSSGSSVEGFVPCTPAGCMLMIEDVRGRDLSGLRAVVLGRSNIVGKPLASLLLRANATVTVCHSRTRDLPEITRTADILVAAAGHPALVRGDWIKPGATVIDVGINRTEVIENGEVKPKLVGDVKFGEALQVAGAITPVPGGVGPMTIIMLMANTLKSAQAAAAAASDRRRYS